MRYLRAVLLLLLFALLLAPPAWAAYTHKCLTQDELLATQNYNADADYDVTTGKRAQMTRQGTAIITAIDALDVDGWVLFFIEDEVYWFKKSR